MECGPHTSVKEARRSKKTGKDEKKGRGEGREVLNSLLSNNVQVRRVSDLERAAQLLRKLHQFAFAALSIRILC